MISRPSDKVLWLHFLPLDVRRACGVTTRLTDWDQCAVLRWLTLLSSVVARDFCVINPGSLDECPIVNAVMADCLPLIEAGAIRFSMREGDFQQHNVKKQRQYRSQTDLYGGFAPSDTHRILNLVARIYPRQIAVGDSIAARFGMEDFFVRAAASGNSRDAQAAAETFPTAAARIRNEGLALTWPELKAAIETPVVLPRTGLPLTLRAYFEANLLQERHAVLTGVPFFEHSEYLVEGTAPINIGSIVHTLAEIGIVEDILFLTARGVRLLRERDEFNALRQLFLRGEKSRIAHAVGAGELLDWARTSIRMAYGLSAEDIRQADMRLGDRIKAVLDRNVGPSAAIVAAVEQHETLGRIIASVRATVGNQYTDAVHSAFEDLLAHIILFCRDRLDAGAYERRGRRGNYLLEADASERDLQMDLHEYLQGNVINADIRTEVSGISTGRADISVSYGSTRFVIELKKTKSVDRNWRGTAQAAAYQAANVRLGFLGLLDVSDDAGLPTHIEDNLWVESCLPPGGTKAFQVVCFRVPARRKRPSELS